jgi:hypothetical protein
MVLLVTLVAGLLVVAESQASDAADRSHTQGFLSKHSGADASQNFLGYYGQFITPNLNHMKSPSISTKDVNPPRVVDKEEGNASDNGTPMSLYAIGVVLMTFVTMLGARMRRGVQPANILAPGLGDNLMEMKSQCSGIGSPLGFDPLDFREGISQSPGSKAHAGNFREAERNHGRIAMLAASQVEKCTGELKQQLTNIGAATVAFVPAAAHAFEFPTLVAPKESELIFTNPFFIAFFIVSIIGGLPLLAFLRLKTVDEDEADLKYSAKMNQSGNTGGGGFFS